MILQFLTGLKCRVVKDDGSPGIDWKLYTWQGGTFSVALPTYEDSAGDSANTNPVIFDARGEASIALLPRAYNFELKDKDGVLVETIENFTLAGSETFEGGYLVDTVADMRALAPGLATLVITRGYNSATDGCGQYYDYNAGSNRPDDGVLVFAPDSAPATGRYLTRYNEAVSIRMAGDPGSLTSSTVQINAAILAISLTQTQKSDLVFPAGFYANDTEEIEFPAGVNVVMEGGAVLLTSTTGEFEFSGGFSAPVDRVFGDDQAITFSCPMLGAYAEWFGAKGDNSTDNLIPIQKLRTATGTTIPLIFAGPEQYLVSSNPGITDSISAIYANAQVIKSDFSEVYVQKGITLSREDGWVKGNTGSFYSNLYVGQNVTVGGSLSIGGTFGAASLESLSGDITSFRDVLADRDVVATRYVTGYVINSLTVVNSPSVVASGTISAITQVSAGGRIRAGSTGQGSLQNRAGTAAHYGEAQVRIGQQFGAVSNSGGGEDDLHSFPLPGNTLVDNDSSLIIKATGAIANNGNGKTIRLEYGSNTIFTSNAVDSNAAIEITRWWLEVRISKTGANQALIEGAISFDALVNIDGSGIAPIAVMSSAVAASIALDTDTLLRVTGQSATSTSNDITGYSLTADYQPKVTNFV